MNYRLLVIEDDRDISNMLKNYLIKEGYDVDTSKDGREGIQMFGSNVYSLVILDLMMPKVNGIDVLRVIRESSLVPVLILSAKDSDIDKTIGLELGADDYITKPFSLIELTARVRSAIRRATKYSVISNTSKVVVLGDLTIDVDGFTVMRGGENVRLTAKEFAILKLFILNPTKVFTKAQIYQSVWAENYYGDENVINVHMRRLREKIEIDPSNPKYLLTLWGIGYKLGAL